MKHRAKCLTLSTLGSWQVGSSFCEFSSDRLQLSKNHHNDWEFLKGFYQREDLAGQQIQALRGDVVQLKAALQHLGYTSQQDRIALNKSHEHMKQLEETFSQSEAIRARIENRLHDEQQEHRMCKMNFDHERKRHEDTERRLECVWNAHHRLQDIMSKVNCVVDDGIQSITYNITDLTLEVAAKSQKIHDLETQIEGDDHEHRAEIYRLTEKFRYESDQTLEDFAAQEERLHELEALLQHEQLKPEREHNQKRTKAELPPGQQKRRRRGKGKTTSVSGEDPERFSDLPIIKEEVDEEVPSPPLL